MKCRTPECTEELPPARPGARYAYCFTCRRNAWRDRSVKLRQKELNRPFKIAAAAKRSKTLRAKYEALVYKRDGVRPGMSVEDFLESKRRKERPHRTEEEIRRMNAMGAEGWPGE